MPGTSMGKDQLKDRAVFAVALMAAFLAFSAYKEELSHIRIQIGSMAPTLSSLFAAFMVFLAISVYFYALDYLKYSYPRFQNLLIFKMTSFLATFFYSVALLFPLLVFASWVASGLPQVPKKFEGALMAFDSIGGAVIGLAAAFNAYYQARRAKNQAIANFDKTRNQPLFRAFMLLDKQFYGEAIVEAFKSLELYLRETLLQKANLYTLGMPMGRVFELALKNGILDAETVQRVIVLQGMRNKAVHSGRTFTREDADQALNIIRSILENQSG